MPKDVYVIAYLFQVKKEGDFIAPSLISLKQ